MILSTNDGMLILPRALFKTGFWISLNTNQRAAVFGILAATVTEPKQYYAVGGWKTLHPGQALLIAEKGIEGLTGRQVRKLLEKMKAAGIIDFSTSIGGAGGGRTVVTVVNWELFSDPALYESKPDTE